jgi:hypothetical protein
MYGFKYLRLNPDGTVVLSDGSSAPYTRTGPYSGTGRLHNVLPLNAPVLGGQDEYPYINYTFFPGDGILRDPERLGWRASSAGAVGPYTGGYHASWTYPDLNSMYLAAVRADGTILTPSFHREYLFGRLDDPANPNWLNATGKYLLLRPRPMDHALDANGKPLFPYPEGRFGDVQNLPTSNGPDSIWMDWGAPVMTSADGRKYKMLFAPMVIDLDGRLNLNIHGNLQGTSSQGYGRHEVNLAAAKVFPVGGEWPNLFQGVNAGTPAFVPGRYGPNGPIGTPGLPVPNGSWYARTYFNSYSAAPPTLPSAFSPFPTFPAGFDTGTVPAQHASRFNIYCTTGSVLGATDLKVGGPIVIASNGHGLTTGDTVTITDVQGNTAANGTFQITVVDVNNFALNGTLSNGVYAGGGTWNRAGDRTLPLSNLEALLRYGDKGSPALTSDLFRMMPQNLQQARIRNLLTLRSFDLAVAGATPWVWDPADATTTYAYNPLTGTSSGPQIVFPPLANRTAGPPPAGSDFDIDWRGLPPVVSNATGGSSGAPTRININRNLANYPAPDPTTGLITDMAAFNTAQSQRQVLALRFYQLLLKATGTRDPRATPGLVDPQPEFQAARWLAQLAVNMVDYIDNDDYMTPFDWLGNGSEILYGVELPRLLLNEAYAQYDNDATDPGIDPTKILDPTKRQANYYRVNAWVELHNPFNSTPAGNPYPLEGGQAILQRNDPNNNNNPFAVYQVLLTRPNAKLTDPANLLGRPDPDPLVNPPQVLATMRQWGANANQQTVLPANGAYSTDPTVAPNQGFYVLGPQTNFLPTRNPNLPSTYLAPTDDTNRLGMSGKVTDATPVPPTVLLQRLACPNLPPSAANPYVTVDYMENVPAYDNRDYLTTVAGPLLDATGMGPKNLPPGAATSVAASVGRRQPYAGNATQVVPQNPTNPAANQPKNTFFRHNAQEDPGQPLGAGPTQTLQQPFDWLVHLDRPVISPIELLQVSACRPHLLTHQFVLGPLPGQKFQHRARWTDQTTRLYRFLELVRTRDLGAGLGGPIRMPGAINVNTVWDPEIFYALLDHPQADQIFQQMVAWRTPGLAVVGPTDHHMNALTATTTGTGYTLNRPFRSLATGFDASLTQYPEATGINNTVLRTFNVGAATGRRLFGVTDSTHPYLRSRVLTKIFNNLTTRSHVFAVWVTVGFFEVKDDSVRPVKLGAEIGRSEGRHIRHRMFAIVDRSDLRLLNAYTVNDVTVPPGQTDKLTLASASGNLTFPTAAGSMFTVQVGDRFVIEPNTDREEDITVTGVGPPGANPPFEFYGICRQSHKAGSVVAFRGNPGPWTSYNPHLDRTVVPHFSVID